MNHQMFFLIRRFRFTPAVIHGDAFALAALTQPTGTARSELGAAPSTKFWTDKGNLVRMWWHPDDHPSRQPSDRSSLPPKTTLSNDHTLTLT